GALLVGMLAAMMWIDAAFYVPAYTGPLSSATGGADFSWLVGMLVGGGAYWLVSRRQVPAEAEVHTEAEVLG
ncbi:MAG: cytosine permease, partial [Actinomycetota bacterium]|nr:cytosine permease [Actinomycetota bacterium]